MQARPVERTNNERQNDQNVLKTKPAGMNRNAPVARITNPTRMPLW